MLKHVPCSRASAWKPGSGVNGIPKNVADEMGSPSYKPKRSTGWVLHGHTGIPVRMTVVNPCSKGLSKDLLRRWYVAADSLILRIDGMCGPDPKRPPSLDLLVYLGAHKKRHAAGQRIDPNNAATGLTTKDALSGAARVIVFRREDAVKALAHELLRCYGVSKWTNQDGEILHRCREAATLLGVHRETLGAWLALYERGGRDGLLKLYVAPGKAPSVTPEVEAQLREALSTPAGFASYGEIQEWLWQNQGIQLAYSTVHTLVRYKLKARPKVARRSNREKNPTP